MVGMRSRPTIPLPKQWSSRVRSGVLYTISLAHFSLTYTHSWAANSWNARTRLKQKNDRLRQELALVREEMRIKDSRMLRIPAQRRPHYPPTERLSILELRAARGWSRSQTARYLLVPPATVGAWMGRLDEEGPQGDRPNPPTRQQVPRVRCLHRPPAQGALPFHGQGQDRPGPLPRRAASRVDHRPANARAEAKAQARPGVEFLSSDRDRQEAESRLALRPDRRPDVARLLDVLASVLVAPALALLPSIPRSSGPCGRGSAQAPNHRPRNAVHG